MTGPCRRPHPGHVLQTTVSRSAFACLLCRVHRYRRVALSSLSIHAHPRPNRQPVLLLSWPRSPPSVSPPSIPPTNQPHPSLPLFLLLSASCPLRFVVFLASPFRVHRRLLISSPPSAGLPSYYHNFFLRRHLGPIDFGHLSTRIPPQRKLQQIITSTFLTKRKTKKEGKSKETAALWKATFTRVCTGRRYPTRQAIFHQLRFVPSF